MFFLATFSFWSELVPFSFLSWSFVASFFACVAIQNGVITRKMDGEEGGCNSVSEPLRGCGGGALKEAEAGVDGAVAHIEYMLQNGFKRVPKSKLCVSRLKGLRSSWRDCGIENGMSMTGTLEFRESWKKPEFRRGYSAVSDVAVNLVDYLVFHGKTIFPFEQRCEIPDDGKIDDLKKLGCYTSAVHVLMGTCFLQLFFSLFCRSLLTSFSLLCRGPPHILRKKWLCRCKGG